MRNPRRNQNLGLGGFYSPESVPHPAGIRPPVENSWRRPWLQQFNAYCIASRFTFLLRCAVHAVNRLPCFPTQKRDSALLVICVQPIQVFLLVFWSIAWENCLFLECWVHLETSSARSVRGIFSPISGPRVFDSVSCLVLPTAVSWRRDVWCVAWPSVDGQCCTWCVRWIVGGLSALYLQRLVSDWSVGIRYYVWSAPSSGVLLQS